ncbi:MAG TPA: hypothetical protein VKU02_26765 [Gemmataceae bacterium]|nr:hypothetical protein [Gemmataceae bacterium]
MNPIRNRIKAHRRVRAGDLVPHEFNFRLHPEQQKAALRSLYQEIGFARSLLAYELPDGRLKLIDGHLRRDLDPEMEVDVEVLDVSDAEARTLLLSIDPLAALAQTNTETHARLRELTPSGSAAIRALWDATARNRAQSESTLAKATQPAREQFLILIECRDEEHQVELLQQFQSDGLSCKALLS